MGWIVLVQSDLQNAADSAALAGAGQLMNGFVSYNLPNQTANQPSILSTAEVRRHGFRQAVRRPQRGRRRVVADAAEQRHRVRLHGRQRQLHGLLRRLCAYPNTVKVTVRRDSTANNPLGLFFGPVLGMSTVNLKATAAATIYAANIDSFANTSSQASGCCP